MPLQPELRRELQQRAATLRAEIEQAAASRSAIRGGEPSDTKDAADRLVADEVHDAEERRDRDELQQVEAALQRLAEGRYDLCADCGEAIAPARLAAQPAALRCAACQARHEARHTG